MGENRFLPPQFPQERVRMYFSHMFKSLSLVSKGEKGLFFSLYSTYFLFKVRLNSQTCHGYCDPDAFGRRSGRTCSRKEAKHRRRRRRRDDALEWQ